jgi:hypothetical protein
MTTDELERELKALAEPRAEDERLRLAIRATLGQQPRPQPRIRRHRMRLGLGAAAVAAATAAIGVVALIGSGGSGGPSTASAAILAHVARAISPPSNLIVHVKETGVQPDGTPVGVEWWQETNARHAIRLIKTYGDQPSEGSADGTTHSSYDPGTNTIYRRPDSRSPTLIDPIETVRAELVRGTADVSGTASIDGRSLYRIELPKGVVGYFDKTDYRPVYLDNPQGDGSVVRTRVVAYEELPLTAGNEKLLSISAQHPDARVETASEPAKQ